jgi:hypothetical protein
MQWEIWVLCFYVVLALLSQLSRPPLEAAIASTVLELITKENLMESAKKVGLILKERLRVLAKSHSIIGESESAHSLLPFICPSL